MIKLITTFITAANAFHVESALTLFADDAVIDDVSVGDPFIGKDGIRSYLEQFFVAYRTTSTVLSLERLANFTTVVRLDFTGDFGHEVGTLKITFDADGLIRNIDADLD